MNISIKYLVSVVGQDVPHDTIFKLNELQYMFSFISTLMTSNIDFKVSIITEEM